MNNEGLVVGKRHIAAEDCLALTREERLHPGAELVETRIKKRDLPFICRTCIYTIAEAKGINCYEICPCPGTSDDCVIKQVEVTK